MSDLFDIDNYADTSEDDDTERVFGLALRKRRVKNLDWALNHNNYKAHI